MSSTTATAAVNAASIAAAASEHTATEHTATEAAQSSMLAITQTEYGSSEVLSLKSIDKPSIGADEVLIEVVAAGVDRGVVHLMTGMPYLLRLAGFGLRRPKNRVLGLEVAGEVIAVGTDVTRFAPGDQVMGIAKGSFAEYAAASQDKLTHKPDNVSFEHAAVSTISGITALQALTTQGNVSAGEQVLVIGASGGVGTFAVQIATALGATVTAVASGTKAEFVRSLGAAEVIDYTTTDLGDVHTEFDLIIDVGGRNSIGKLRQILKSTGRLVIVGGEGGGRLTGGIGRQLRAALLSPFIKQQLSFFLSSETLEYIEPVAEMVASGEITPAIGERRPLAETPEAIAVLEAGHASGKIVIEVAR